MWDQVRILILIGLTLFSGLADSHGFFHASSMWDGKKVVWTEFAKAAMGFVFGFLMYLIAIRYMNEFGIISPEIQTTTWFGVTIVGVAILSGKFAHWQTVDQVVALGVIVGIGWLLFRTGG